MSQFPPEKLQTWIEQALWNFLKSINIWREIQVRIQDLVKGGPSFWGRKVADVAEWSHMSEVSYLWPALRALKWALEAFGFLMLKYAFPHSRDSFSLIFDIYFQHQKLIKIEH